MPFSAALSSKRPRSSFVIFFLEIDHISKAPAAISDAGRGVNLDFCLQQNPLDVRQGSKTIVTLDQESMLRTCHYPPQLLGKLIGCAVKTPSIR